jgi:hypothetical protein
MQIVNGLWVQLIDERNARVLFQVTSDAVTDDEFSKLWVLVGNTVKNVFNKNNDGCCEFKIRAYKVGK